MAYVLMGVMGLSGGMLVAAGLVALLMALSIIPRYAAVTGTREYIGLYENYVMAGTIIGNLFQIFEWKLPLGQAGLLVYGLFSGIFLGSWILALAELADIFPIMFRRIKLRMGMGILIVSIALGKVCGSLLYYIKGW